MTDLLPHFVIIGAQKTGSTYVHGLLRAHPDIYMPAEEERFFEDPEYGDGDTARLSALFRNCAEALRGIKRPDYLARPEVPARIRRHVPDARLIAILRDPIDRLVSAYYYYIKLGFLPVLDINQGVRRILDGDDLGSPRARELLEYGRYATHIERYLAIFPRNQLLILLQEAMTAAPLEMANQIARFIGARPFASLPPVARDNSGLYSLPRLRLLTQRNRLLYDYDAFGKLVKKTGPLRYAGAAAVTACDRYLLAPVLGNERPVLDAAIRDQLTEFYQPEMDRLQTLLGDQMCVWSGGRA